VNQSDYRIRLDWGPTGAAAIAPGAAVIAVGADVIAVVDVLSFSTTLTVAVERGIPVLPFRWGSADASRSARRHGATLGVAGRGWPGPGTSACRPARSCAARASSGGAGAFVAALGDEGCSVAARSALVAYESINDLEKALGEGASGRELIGQGFADDVAVAAAVGSSAAVPVLVDGWFVAG
jgi:phosphosulfolactate phosphohydrolase-like enzyme